MKKLLIVFKVKPSLKELQQLYFSRRYVPDPDRKYRIQTKEEIIADLKASTFKRRSDKHRKLQRIPTEGLLKEYRDIRAQAIALSGKIKTGLHLLDPIVKYRYFALENELQDRDPTN